MATGPDRYRQFEIEKKSGGKRPVEDPVAPLKRVQGRIAKMLARIEPPSFLFCPVKGRCYVSNAARHRGNRVVHCLDIKKFFPNTPRVRVIAFFQSIMGCRADVAGILGDLCTFEGHLPTGSPLSPILAYYSYHDMWAESAAFCTGKGYTLTVYVGDVTISGAKVPVADVWHVRRMIHRTGLRYHKLKHYVDRPAEITGVVVRDGKVVVHPDGYIEITDRKKDIIVNSGGDNISPARLEGKLTLEPEILQAMVYGDKRPYLVAVVVPDPAFVEDWASQNGRSARLETLCDSEAFRKAVGRARSEEHTSELQSLM